MPEQIGPIAVMFADMTGSTRLYDSLGNTSAVDVVTQCIGALTKVVRQFRGTVIKTIGDEVMCTFPEATHAAVAASEMHMSVRHLVESGALQVDGLQVKVGVHYGVVLAEEGDIFGDAVNVAARMAALAKADQTLVTRNVVEAMAPELQGTIRFYDNVDLKGKAEKFEVFEIIWEVSDMTVAADTTPKVARLEHSLLRLEVGGETVELGQAHPSVSLGRADDNEVRCAGALTSRKHARIEFRRGRFVLTDQSANGTFLHPDGEGLVPLRRDYYQLEGRGSIGLGEPPEEMGVLAIRYECE